MMEAVAPSHDPLIETDQFVPEGNPVSVNVTANRPRNEKSMTTGNAFPLTVRLPELGVTENPRGGRISYEYVPLGSRKDISEDDVDRPVPLRSTDHSAPADSPDALKVTG